MSTQFAQDLRLARRKAGYTQGDLAHLLGCQQSLVSEFEHGKVRPSLTHIIELSLIYGRSFESFFGEVMAEAREEVSIRLLGLPDPGRATAHTFNRDGSLAKLQRRLKQETDHGGA